jgi:hypothetical protein
MKQNVGDQWCDRPPARRLLKLRKTLGAENLLKWEIGGCHAAQKTEVDRGWIGIDHWRIAAIRR